jgi:uncharacterized protein YktA (UPF0223 family)
MFEPSDFELKLEAQLKLRVITDEINQCDDVEALRENLINVTTLFMKYQHLLNTVISKQMEKNISELLKTQLKEDDQRI